MERAYTYILEPIKPSADGETSWYRCTVKEFPDVLIVQKTSPRALADTQDAVEGLCDLLKEQGRPLPKPAYLNQKDL